MEGIPVVSLPPPRLARLSGLIKRAMDLTLATIGVVLLSPFLLVVALAIRMTSPGPVIFRQVRMGYEGTPFEIFKFRTMVANAEDLKAEVSHLNVHLADDPRMFKIPDDPRGRRAWGGSCGDGTSMSCPSSSMSSEARCRWWDPAP